jgi:hypothetical protein
MALSKSEKGKKYFTVAEANAALPLVRAIVRDITELARDLRDRHERLTRVRPVERAKIGESYEEEIQHIQQEFERDQERMHEFEQELKALGVELKDYYTGLLDFPCWMDNHEVYLCWRLGEPEVAYWHELDAGFAGRQKLPRSEAKGEKSEARI